MCSTELVPVAVPFALRRYGDCGRGERHAAVIMNDSELVRLLRHLRLPTDFPKTVSARSRPNLPNAVGLDVSNLRRSESSIRPPPDPFDDCGLDPRVELYEGIDALPDYNGPQG